MINERLQSTLKGYRLIVNVTPVLVFPLIVIMISCCFIGQDVLGVLIGIGGSLATAFLHFSAKERIKSILSDNISGIVVKETFGDPAEYDPDGRVTPGPMAHL